MRGFTLDQLRTFAEVVESGTFSAAAERLGLSQPAVSLQVRELERRLGVRLIERVGRTARPTAAGAAFMEHAARIDAAVEGALDVMARHATGALGRVHIGTGATACIYVLPPILRQLRRRAPTLEITVTTGNSADVIKAVERNRIDVGLVTMPASGRMLQVTPVMKDGFVVMAPKDRPLPARVMPAMLATIPMVSFEPGGTTRKLVDTWFARAGFSIKPVMSLGSVEAIKEVVAAGLGCAILPRMSVDDVVARGDVIVRQLSPALNRTLALVIRRDKPLNRGLQEVIGAISELRISTFARSRSRL